MARSTRSKGALAHVFYDDDVNSMIPVLRAGDFVHVNTTVFEKMAKKRVRPIAHSIALRYDSTTGILVYYDVNGNAHAIPSTRYDWGNVNRLLGEISSALGEGAGHREPVMHTLETLNPELHRRGVDHVEAEIAAGRCDADAGCGTYVQHVIRLSR